MLNPYEIIEWLVKYSIWFSVPMRFVASFGNSFCDSIIFSPAYGKKETLWHGIKYFVDRPGYALFWFLTFGVIWKQHYNDWWHFTNEFLIWLTAFFLGFIFWQINYRYWKKYWKKKYEK